MQMVLEDMVVTMKRYINMLQLRCYAYSYNIKTLRVIKQEQVEYRAKLAKREAKAAQIGRAPRGKAPVAPHKRGRRTTKST